MSIRKKTTFTAEYGRASDNFIGNARDEVVIKVERPQGLNDVNEHPKKTPTDKQGKAPYKFIGNEIDEEMLCSV